MASQPHLQASLLTAGWPSQSQITMSQSSVGQPKQGGANQSQNYSQSQLASQNGSVAILPVSEQTVSSGDKVCSI